MNASCREAALGMTVWYTLGYFRRNLSTLAHEHWNVSNGTNYTTYSIMLQRKEKCCLLSLVAYNNYLSTFPLILQWNRVNGELKHKKVSFFFFFLVQFHPYGKALLVSHAKNLNSNDKCLLHIPCGRCWLKELMLFARIKSHQKQNEGGPAPAKAPRLIRCQCSGSIHRRKNNW